MNLFGFLNKKVKKNIFTRDKAAWQYQSCLEEFCKVNNKNENEITEEDQDYIWECSGLLISYFLTWLVNNDYIVTDISPDVINDVKKRKLKTTVFFGQEFDFSLFREDISTSIIDFVDSYYNDGFYNDYQNYMDLNGKDIFCSDFSWDDYDNLEKIINDAYSKYKNN